MRVGWAASGGIVEVAASHVVATGRPLAIAAHVATRAAPLACFGVPKMNADFIDLVSAAVVGRDPSRLRVRLTDDPVGTGQDAEITRIARLRMREALAR